MGGYQAAKDLRAYVDANNADVTQGTNLFVGPERPVSHGVPHKCVFIDPVGNPEPIERVHDGDYPNYSLQVIVRGDEGDWAGAITLAESVYETIKAAQHNVAGYWMTEPEYDEPGHAGTDNAGRHRFTFLVSMRARN